MQRAVEDGFEVSGIDAVADTDTVADAGAGVVLTDDDDSRDDEGATSFKGGRRVAMASLARLADANGHSKRQREEKILDDELCQVGSGWK